ncbi:ABC transporter permease [candidate division KSB1 bacterium]
MQISYNKISFSRYIELVFAIAAKNVKLRYKNSLLGFLWTLLNPLIFLLIFTFIFRQAFPDIENYELYALTGLIFWSFFASGTVQIINSLIESAIIIKSIYVPSIIFPTSALIASLINLLLSLIPFTFLMLLLGFDPGIEALLVFPMILLFAFFTFGFSLVVCALNVYFRDIGIFWNTLLPAVFYFTPIAYSFRLVPESMQWVVKLNPLFHFIELFRSVLYYNQLPDASLTLICCALSGGFLVLGLIIFRSLKKWFISNF